jgi:hypothetical protein
MKKEKKSNKKSTVFKGITVIETLITVFLILIVTLSFYGMIILAGKIVADSKLRTMGLYLANEEMENIKSMAYDKIGTEGGIPSGDLLQNRNVEKGGYSFNVSTEVKYSDDETDGLFPEDDNPSDYKTVRLEVSWPSSFKEKEIVLVTSMYPDILEQAGEGGILSINAINFEGVGIGECSVEIANPDLDPPVLINSGTDSTGNLTLYAVPPSQEGYQVKLEKTGYETVSTFPLYPTSSFNPVDKHVSVVAGKLNARSLQINELGDLTVQILDESSLPLPNFSVALKGGRIIGYSEEENPQTIYSFDENDLITNGSGIIALDDTSPGNYFFSINDSNYEIVKINPGNPFELSAGGTTDAQATCVANTVDSLLIIVQDNLTKEAIPEASATVTGPNYSAVDQTDALGKAFFWQELMEQGEYQINVEADGYVSYSGTSSLLGLTKVEIYLDAVE